MEIIYTDLKFNGKLIPLDPNKVDTIFIHHPAWKIATIEMIHNDHLKKGWAGVGYNEYIRKDGKVYIGRGDYIGAQAHKYNSRSYGICVEGDYDIEPSPPDYLLYIVAERAVEAQRRFPNAKIVLTHSARYNTNCPGKNFSMGRLYNLINEVYKKKNTPKHWVEEKGIISRLKNDYGIEIHEKRYDEPMTRAESFSMDLRILDSIKKYIDSK